MACTRKNQSTLTASEKSRFVSALLALKANGKYDQYVQEHVNTMGSAHRGPAFFPWHRAFLRRLEMDLQAVDSSVSLPYWNWSLDNSPVSSIWNAELMGGNGRPSDGRVMTGPFAFDAGNWTLTVGANPDLRRRFGVGIATLPAPADVSAALGVTPYDVSPWSLSSGGGFRNTAEGWIAGPQMHNRVHVWVGGTMLPLASPEDPVFFLHHCFVDKLWADWQTLHAAEDYLPASGAPAGHNRNDPMEPWATKGETVTPASVLDYRAMGYGYDTDPECVKRSIKEIKDFKEGKREKLEIKEIKERKLEKVELKERKVEKLEQKEIRFEKERIPEKRIREKGWVEVDPRPPREEIRVEPRLDELQGQVDELRHFIGSELRPDLGLGALKGEPDLGLRELAESQEDEANIAKIEKLNKDIEKLSEQPPDGPPPARRP